LAGKALQKIVVRICLSTALLVCIYAVLRRGMGAWYFQQKSPEAVQNAIRWDPHNAEYYDALATLRHLYADNENAEEQVKLYVHAVSLSPRNAHFWADLGMAYDWAGNGNEAIRAFEQAIKLSPNSPDINWKFANFCLRAGRTSEGLQALRKVLIGGTVPREDVFALAVMATPDQNAILEEAVTPEAPVLFDYLNYLAKTGDMAGAKQVWERLLAVNSPFDLRMTFFYLDTLIQKRETKQLADAWSALGSRFPEKVGSLNAVPNLVANGGFESDILNGGLDWRVVPVEGARVTTDLQEACEGERSVRVDFDGTQNLDYAHLFQYVLVRPNTRYRFSGYMRAEGVTTDSGPRFQVFDPYDAGKEFFATRNVIGSSEWGEQPLEFKTAADTRLLLIRIARPPSGKFDNKIAGTVWIDGVRLTEED
jgi:tetratricopeptide (TPR) repeat protein